jgi:hypothetical protein
VVALIQFVLLILWIVTVTLNGLRSAQLFHLAGYVVQLIYYLFFFLIAGYKMTFLANWLYFTGLVIYIISCCVYGEGDLTRLKIKGHYMIGVK